MKHMIIALVGGLLLALLFYSEPVLAVGGNDDIDKPMSEAQQNFENGQQAVYKAKYDKAIGYLKRALELERKHADAYNYLGFAYRKKGNLKLAGLAYQEALKINPDHKGVLEYQGEMYLKLGDLNAARRNQAHLQSLCSNGCDELKELTRAIADFRATSPSRGS
jgi:tetratricopeptide (TPR) repeat protein